MKEFAYHVALLTVTDTEETGLRMQYRDWKEIAFPDDRQGYYETAFVRDGRVCRVAAARQKEMGMTAGATLSMKLIEHFRPKYLIMVGLAAGVARADMVEQLYSDVVVADVVWNYTAGKFVSPDKAEIRYGDLGFIPRPTALRLDSEIVACIRRAAQSPENQCHVHIGPMACGSSVVANSEILEKQIRSQMAQTAGLDMESYAVAYAAVNATEPRPCPIIIKSVCDYADSQKDDRFQKFAAYTSAEFAKLLYEKFLPL